MIRSLSSILNRVNPNFECIKMASELPKASWQILFALFMVAGFAIAKSSTEYHADEESKFSEFRAQTNFAEDELRKELQLNAEDEVHLSTVALRVSWCGCAIRKFNISMYIIWFIDSHKVYSNKKYLNYSKWQYFWKKEISWRKFGNNNKINNNDVYPSMRWPVFFCFCVHLALFDQLNSWMNVR